MCWEKKCTSSASKKSDAFVTTSGLTVRGSPIMARSPSLRACAPECRHRRTYSRTRRNVCVCVLWRDKKNKSSTTRVQCRRLHMGKRLVSHYLTQIYRNKTEEAKTTAPSCVHTDSCRKVATKRKKTSHQTCSRSCFCVSQVRRERNTHTTRAPVVAARDPETRASIVHVFPASLKWLLSESAE